MSNRDLFVRFCPFVAAIIFGVACSSGGTETKVDRNAPLKSESDSLAYIVGLSIADQLMAMDSTINVEVVCRAILEHANGGALIDMEDARVAYLRYIYHVDPERQRGYEEKFLADMAASNRSYVRTKSGLNYNIEVIGDEKMMPKLPNDWVSISYQIFDIDGEQIYPPLIDSTDLENSLMALERGDDIKAMESHILKSLPNGVEEALRLIGKGGKIDLWVPSKLGYGDEGDAERGIAPQTTLHYKVELVDIESNKGMQRLQEQMDNEF